MPRRLLLALALLAFAAGPAGACEAPEPVHLRITHATFGDLGRHDVTFRCEGGRLVAETRAEIEVRLLVVPVFNRTVHYLEVWEGDRLVAFDGTTIDGDERFVVRARRADGRMLIEGPGGRIEAPAHVIPSHPWNPVSVERTLLFDVVDGVLLEVENRFVGEEPLTIDGEPVTARRWVTTGGAARELWYDRDGRWLQWRLERQGTVTLTREGLL